jgi:type IV pilus assembly protein PilQ
MDKRSTRYWLAVFFCSTGLVCAGPVNADEGVAPATPAATPLFEGDPADAPLPQGQRVNVGSFGQIDLAVKDLDLTKVLQLLSIQSQRNIIANRNVAGTVSANLYGVDFYEALDAILHPNGFGYEEKGQFIYVYTQDELRARQEAMRKLSTRLVRLNYISAADAAAFMTPLLSDRGSLSVSGDAVAGMAPSIANAGANSFAHADTVVIRDFEENINEIVAVVEQLDVRPKQVLVEATVLQARLTEQNALGVDISILVDYDFNDMVGSPLNVVDKLIGGNVTGASGQPVTTRIGSGGGLQTGVGNTQAPGGMKIGVLSDNVSAFVRALDQVTDTTVLANPKLLVLNRQRADLLVGGRLGYLSTTQTETASTQTVEFLDVGTQLTVRPFVGTDDMIRLELRPELSDGETISEGGFVIPNKTTQTLTTNVMVRSAQTVVLGGLFKENTTVTRRQVPGLGSVPLLGAAFRGQDDTVERNEVIFLIKPTIMRDERLYAMGEAVQGDVELAALGARRGLLPWSRTKLTATYVREAIDYAEAGNHDKALWYTNLVLHLDPNMVEALRLREQLTGEKMHYISDSILHRAVNSTIDDQIEELQRLNSAVEPTGDNTRPADASAEVTEDAVIRTAADEFVDSLDVFSGVETQY